MHLLLLKGKKWHRLDFLLLFTVTFYWEMKSNSQKSWENNEKNSHMFTFQPGLPIANLSLFIIVFPSLWRMVFEGLKTRTKRRTHGYALSYSSFLLLILNVKYVCIQTCHHHENYVRAVDYYTIKCPYQLTCLPKPLLSWSCYQVNIITVLYINTDNLSENKWGYQVDYRICLLLVVAGTFSRDSCLFY